VVVTEIGGQVEIIRAGKDKPTDAGLGNTLEIDDKIVTDEDSWVELSFIDGTILKVEENASLTLKDLHMAMEGPFEQKTLIRKLLELLKGTIKFTSGSEAKGSEFRTPSAWIGIRGTEFILEVTEDGRTTVTVLNGGVELSDRVGAKGVVVHRHETSVVKSGGTPAPPQPADPEVLARWGESVEKPFSSGPSPWLWLVIALATVLIAVFSIRKYRLSHRYQTETKPELKQGTAGEMKYLPYCSRCGAHLKLGASLCHRCGAPATRDIKRG
jgi:hypothetical protein